jgi:hypothetical protein
LPDGQISLIAFAALGLLARPKQLRNRLRANTNFASAFKPMLLSASSCAKISLSENQKMCIDAPSRRSKRGVCASSRNVRRDAMDA